MSVYIYKKWKPPPRAPLLQQYPILKIALISCIEINVVNNTKLYTNVQNILTLIYVKRPKNISLNYKPKQKEFKVGSRYFIK
jgi:hypothetical protein